MHANLNKFDQCQCELGQQNCIGLVCSPQPPNEEARKADLSMSNKRRMDKSFTKFKAFAAIGALILIIICTYKLWMLIGTNWEQTEVSRQKRHLKMINMFHRHGDRSPSENFPKSDKHADHLEFFWPDGLTNLTDAGRLRLYMIGLDTRQRYDNYLGRDSSKILALSSHIYRCIESIEFLLRGLYDTEWTRSTGFTLLKSSKETNCTSGDCLPDGLGSKDEWKSIHLDTETLPTLSYDYITECDYFKTHPNPVDSNLMADPEIRSLPGIGKLKDLLKVKYGQDFNITAPSIWSTICSELELIRTKSSFEYTDHFRDWIFEPVARQGDSVITLFDVFEEVSVLAYRDSMVGQVNRIQSGTLLTSLIESQLVALGQNVTNKANDIYKDKKMVVYSTHDSILQLFLFTIGLIRTDRGSFEERFFKWNKRREAQRDDQLGKFLDGLKMANYGISIRFELLELEQEEMNVRTNVVQAFIYNREEPKAHEVKFELVELGEACRRLFMSKYESEWDLDQFYPKEVYIDHKLDCPFDLFRNVTSELVISGEEVAELCVKNSNV